MYFFSKTTSGFYSREIHGANIPSDAVEIDVQEYSLLLKGQSAGRVIGIDTDGRPTLIDPQPISSDEIEIVRLKAYADPINGSDRYFAEAARLQATGGNRDEIESVLAAGIARYAEIQQEYPWSRQLSKSY